MLHLLNGDATAAVFPASLPGDRAVWRDIMVEGPAVDDARARARVLAPRLGIEVEDYEQQWRDSRATLETAAGHDEVVLWFEQDLFCAVNLWFVLARLPSTARVSLVFPALTGSFRGLGTLTAGDFPALYAERTPLSVTARADGVALWTAYAAAEPTAMTRLSARLPFASDAARLHLGRFPSADDGLDEIEAATLGTLLSGARTFTELFVAVMHAPPRHRHGMGDVQYAAALRDLQPLVAISDAAAPPSQWRVAATPAAADVLGRRVDGFACRALDRWLGGVHLRPGAAPWRWDGARLVHA
jgi:hypothetical protein